MKDIVKCIGCGLEFVHPSPTEQELNFFYSHYCDVRADKEIVGINSRMNRLHLRKFYGITQDSYVLDYGCGDNLFIKGDDWIGYDRFKNPIGYKSQKYDCITMWGVLEHLTDSHAELQELVSLLIDDGIVVLTTVTTESKIPYQYKPPEHLTYWSKESITRLFNRCGLEIIEYRPYEMYQLSSIYMDILLRTTPEEYKKQIKHTLPRIIKIPTNEVFVVAKKE